MDSLILKGGRLRLDRLGRSVRETADAHASGALNAIWIDGISTEHQRLGA